MPSTCPNYHRVLFSNFSIINPTIVAISQRPLKRIKSESMLSGSFERQRFSRRSLKERAGSQRPLFRQDTIHLPIHSQSINFDLEPLDIRLISSSFRSSFFATICLFVVIDFVFRLQNYTIQTIPPNFFLLFF